jgi:hypothetical protein
VLLIGRCEMCLYAPQLKLIISVAFNLCKKAVAFSPFLLSAAAILRSRHHEKTIVRSRNLHQRQ